MSKVEIEKILETLSLLNEDSEELDFWKSIYDYLDLPEKETLEGRVKEELKKLSSN